MSEQVEIDVVVTRGMVPYDTVKRVPKGRGRKNQTVHTRWAMYKSKDYRIYDLYEGKRPFIQTLEQR